MMHVGLFHSPVLALGPGERIGIWLQGCSKRCAGCISPGFQPFKADMGIKVADLIRSTKKIYKSNKRICGITLTGGEPFEQKESVIAFLHGLRKEADLDVLIYSGLTWDEISKDHYEILNLASAVISGPFMLGKESREHWRGSSNQTMTLLDITHRERYASWLEQSRRKMQLIKDNNGGRYVIGIPEQRHTALIQQHLSV